MKDAHANFDEQLRDCSKKKIPAEIILENTQMTTRTGKTSW